MNPLDEILDMLTEATQFADELVGPRPGIQAHTGFFMGVYLAHKHPQYASSLFPLVQEKLGPTENMFATMINAWVERIPIEAD